MPKRVSCFPLPAADSIGDACESAASQLMSDILLIHAAVTLPLGGASGVLSYELLDSAAHRPFATFGNDVFYETGLEQAAALLESLVLNHAFEDGNKRTALAACLYFLDRCTYWRNIAYLSDNEAHKLEELTLLLANERRLVQEGMLKSLPDIPAIAVRLDQILGSSRNRRPRPSRLLSGTYRRISDLFRS
ncbi:MAG TPA: Fic family protein [Ktedonobacterales bacterium]|nr:Fic family protein [Ktedonobacterales bacterium]